MSKAPKPFDFSKFKQRYIALKILYFGWDYDGLATQASSENTIEHHLFQALTKTCLIESREKCKYNRCGRTDKGVSSYGQVVNLIIRSNLTDESDPNNLGLFTPPEYQSPPECNTNKQRQEINYVDTLNRVLPDHIKAIAWSPVSENFSSRFSCKGRSYSYIFPRGDLCVESMTKGLLYLVGQHDFRNLCSFDLKNGVKNHVRTINSTSLRSLAGENDGTPSGEDPYKFLEVIIEGQAFLYHQIRCIMTLVFLVGTKQENPEIIRDLLDIEKCPSRPNYNRASPVPLCLFDCVYNPNDMPLGWYYDLTATHNLLKKLKHLWLDYKSKALMIERAMLNVETIIDSRGALPDDTTTRHGCSGKRPKLNLGRWKDFGLECDNMSDVKYVPVLKRPRDETLEFKLEQIEKKRVKDTSKVP